MTPDDPRHGTNAGYLAHRRNNQTACEPCQAARRRLNKHWNHRRQTGTPAMVPIGTTALEALRLHNPAEAARRTGIYVRHIKKLLTKGPDAKVRRTTKAAILTHLKPEATNIGMTRRTQALAAIGYSSARLSTETGIGRDALKTIRNRVPNYVHQRTRDALVEAYDRLSMTPLPETRSSRRARNAAAQNGWASPLAWNNIDDPDETPKVPTRISDKVRHRWTVDPVRVDRIILDRDRAAAADATPAERRETVRRWLNNGDTLGDLERITGWNSNRYIGDVA